ncbi:BnaC04g13680D [Brassica napus]|uniref:BnaC04g13680D protein n=1 Tax=Brassica napus TaxID=3708 RepID=A0A078GJI7_BRANA|nr:BnaC04g13680D [Brassica napus]
MMMWISKLAKAVCFVTGLTWKGGHDEAAAATMYLKDTLTTEEQQQLITCLSKDKHSISHTSSRRLGHHEARDQTYTLTEVDEFLIMRCEGIWDVLTSQEEVTELALEASRLNTFDNVSVVVVCFLSADEMVTRLLRRRSNGVVV